MRWASECLDVTSAPLAGAMRVDNLDEKSFIVMRRHLEKDALQLVTPVLFQPMAADDVASGVGRIAVGPPVNGIVEIGGPEQFRLDELVRRRLVTLKDPREVVADPHARYAGAEVGERTLLPGKDARLGETRFDTWVTQSAAVATAATEA